MGFYGSIRITSTCLLCFFYYSIGNNLKTIEIYNFNANSWRFGASSETAVTNPAYVYLNDQYMIRMGNGQDVIYCYDIKYDEWTLGDTNFETATIRSSYLLLDKDFFGCSFD